MSKSLYRKYRSQSLDEIVGQKGVVRALKNAVAKDAISHAYLFTGPRGVGKTSIARILAFAIIGKPYNIDTLPIDIIEIDAASNRGIDEVRDLREKVRIAPIESKYKVYIIDEVHMLTSHAFNALLKTLEEPPSHVVFILATTESHKLPETIISRTQRYNFSLATIDEVTEHLAKISKSENINIDKKALKLIAQHSGGSLRDAISTLDHARHLNDTITAKDIMINIGIPSENIVDAILNAISYNDIGSLLKELETAESDNITPLSLANNLILAIKKDLKSNQPKISIKKSVELIKDLSTIETKTQADTALFITLLEAVDNNSTKPKTPENTIKPTVPNSDTNKLIIKNLKKPADAINLNLSESVKNNEPKLSEDQISNDLESNLPQIDNYIKNISGQVVKEKETLNTLESKNSPIDTSYELNESTWKLILEDVRSTHNTLYSVLRTAKIDLSEVSNKKINLNLQFPFHHKRLSEAKNKDVIMQKLHNFGIDGYEIVCNLIKTNKQNLDSNPVNDNLNAEAEDLALNQIRGIFGSAEPI